MKQGIKAVEGRVLVVDDDPYLLDIMNRWLNREGFLVTAANGGAAALALVTEKEFDVILLDVMMPEMDGLQVCRKLRENPVWRQIPVILLTAKDDLDTRAQGMILGVSEYLTKPVNKTELLIRLRAQVKTHLLQEQLAATERTIEKK